MRLYNLEFKDLSDKYCDKAPWPSAPAVASQCIGNDGQPDAYFLCVYKELVYRHMFAKLKTSLDDKLNAWNNYCELFEFVLASEDASLELTAQWVPLLWPLGPPIFPKCGISVAEIRR